MRGPARLTRNGSRTPSARAIWDALFKTTEALAHELACPASRPPVWSDFEWRIAQAVSAIHGISPMLAGRLKWQGPPSWSRFLDEQQAHTASRQRRAADLIERIDRGARSSGVALVALKGAALHQLGIYQSGERPMADLDLLVRREQRDAAAALLGSLGYHRSGITWKHEVFEPTGADTHGGLGEHPERCVKIELHDRLIERLPLSELEISELVLDAGAAAGLNPYRSRALLMMHLLFHAAGAMVAKGLRLIQLHDIALLSQRMTRADWDELIEKSTRSGVGSWWALPPLALVGRYYAGAVPSRVIQEIRPSCPRNLARIAFQATISESSLSYPWVVALPGICWCGSSAEALKYVASRITPPVWRREELSYAVESQTWAASDDWYRMPQLRRVLRWLLTRPTRIQTMYVVRIALATPS